MTSFRSLDDADVKGKRVLVRVDLNVPMNDGEPRCRRRLELAAAMAGRFAPSPTIRQLR